MAATSSAGAECLSTKPEAPASRARRAKLASAQLAQVSGGTKIAWLERYYIVPPLVLAAAGVTCKTGRVERLEPQAGAGWQLTLSDGSSLSAAQLVLAAGAHCRQLWPALPQRLRSSWAAALQLASFPAPLGRAAAWLPVSFGRVALERSAAGLSQPEWLVDGGLVPRAEGALLGQHTLVRPGLELGAAPPPLEVEQQLRQELAAQAWGAPLAALPGYLRQAAVAFCSEGLPLVGPLADAPDLWMFTGFSAGFSQVPVLAPLLAQVLVSGGARSEAAMRRLQQLGLTGDPVVQGHHVRGRHQILCRVEAGEIG